jgi:hypothetical protein
MNKTNLEYIRMMTEAITITAEKKVLLNGKIVEVNQDDAYAKEPSGKMLFDTLHRLIYMEFYIQPCESLSNDVPVAASLKENIDLLSKANTSTDGFDGGWVVVDHKDDLDISLAKKGNRIKKLLPGEFLYDQTGINKDSIQKTVRFFLPKEYAHVQETFYYAYGTTAIDNDDNFRCRFYFNNSFAGNIQLVSLFSGYLNEFKIPFIFKCLLHPFYYGRSDTAVLYLNMQYVNFFFDYLNGIYNEIMDTLRDSLPLFVYPVRKGIGFAEQPKDANESFGSHWSKIIAAGLMKAYEEKITKDRWPEEVLKHIQQNHGYQNLQKLYINPMSYFPYSFEADLLK